MDGRPSIQLIFKINPERIAHIGTDDQRSNLLARLRDRKLKQLFCIFLNSFQILF